MLQKMQELGLNGYEIRTYTDLLHNGAAKGGEIAKRSGVPQGKVYLVLHSLAEKGLIQVSQGKPQLFSPLDPEVALKAMVDERMAELALLKKSLVDDAKKMRKPSFEPGIAERVQVSSGKKQRYALNDHLFMDAKKEVRFMHSYEVRFPEFVRLVRETIERGIPVRFLAIAVDEKRLGWMKEDVQMGVQVRYLPADDIRIQVMDDAESRISVVNPRDTRDRVTVHFHHGEMSRHLKEHFDALWGKAKSITRKTTLQELKLFNPSQK